MTGAIIHEAEFLETMRGTVLPYLAARKTSGFFERTPGEALYYERYDADSPQGVVAVVHGYSSAIPKFYECVWYFLQNGYSVYLLQQRSHGLSFREADDPALIEIKDYRNLVFDLRHFLKKIILSENGSLPLYLFAHSMGGAVGASYLEHYPNDFQKAVLTSPMLGLNSGGTPIFGAFVLAELKIRHGKGTEAASGAEPFSGIPDFEGSHATSRARYDYYFEIVKENPAYQMCVTTWDTALSLFRITQDAMRRENLPKVRADVLLFQAEHDSLVMPEPQERFIEGIPHGTLVRVAGAKHEIYRSEEKILTGYWNKIFDFLAG